MSESDLPTPSDEHLATDLVANTTTMAIANALIQTGTIEKEAMRHSIVDLRQALASGEGEMVDDLDRITLARTLASLDRLITNLDPTE